MSGSPLEGARTARPRSVKAGPGPERHGWRTARRILCVRLDAMGDVVMTEPALRALKATEANRQITLLTSEAGARAAELMPQVDETIVYRAPWMKATESGPGSAPDWRMVERLRRGRYDAAVIFTVYSQSPLPAALLLHLADIPLRIAYCRENPYGLLSDWIEETEPEEQVRHEVQRHLDLVARAGGVTSDERIRVHPKTGTAERVARSLEHSGLTDRRNWYVVHVGASAPSRRYPAEYFAQAIRKLYTRHGLTPVLTGSEEERALVSSVLELSRVPALDLSGSLDLHELCALLDRAPLLLANNTGPVHLAAGVGTPVVDVYALTNPQHTPWQVPSRVLFNDVACRFCYRSICPEGHHACLRGVGPDEVVEAVVELLAETLPQEREDRLSPASSRELSVGNA